MSRSRPFKERGIVPSGRGAAFEDSVAALYRLLGATVTQNISVHGKKVDILAEFSGFGGTSPHRVLVECKDEARRVAQNQRVMEFKGLLATARAAGTADSAEIITRVPWSDAAKGFARDAGLAVLTYQEKVANLLDLRPYLTALVREFSEPQGLTQEEPALSACYVNPVIGQDIEGKFRIIDFRQLFEEWLGKETVEYHMAVLGSYGIGKSSLCRKIAHDLAKMSLNKKLGFVARIPILIDLRRFTKTVDIEAFICSFLDEKCGVVNPRYRLFEMMNNEGLFVLILDGFDEMAVRVDGDTLQMNIAEIEKLAMSPRSRVFITGRQEYFISSEEESRLFRPLGRKQEALESRSTAYLGLRMALWDNSQISEFLRLRIPLIKDRRLPWTVYRKQIQEIPGLSDLAQRPVLLSMIVRTLPELVESGKEINRANLYETYLQGELRRQKIDKRRQLLLTEQMRFEILEDLALEFHTSRGGITFRDARERVARATRKTNEELEHLARDFLTCSFLLREGNEYRLSHRSIMEYLAARGLAREFKTDQPIWFGASPIVPAVWTFLSELDPPVEAAWRWLGRGSSTGGGRALGTNAGQFLIEREGAPLAEGMPDGVRIWAAIGLGEREAREVLRMSVGGVSDVGGRWLTREGASLVMFAVGPVEGNDPLEILRALGGLDLVGAIGIGVESRKVCSVITKDESWLGRSLKAVVWMGPDGPVFPPTDETEQGSWWARWWQASRR